MNKRAFAAVAASILVALVSAPASAKTKAECVREWQADKAANQAAHITEKAYVAECLEWPLPRPPPSRRAPANRPTKLLHGNPPQVWDHQACGWLTCPGPEPGTVSAAEFETAPAQGRGKAIPRRRVKLAP